jgi:hypothetical protein
VAAYRSAHDTGTTKPNPNHNRSHLARLEAMPGKMTFAICHDGKRLE